MKRRRGSISMIAALALLAVGGRAKASSHREAPAISSDPEADNTDLYAWVAPGSHDKLYVIANWIPLEEPSGGPNFHRFSDDVLYEIHVVRGHSLDDAVTYQFRFHTAEVKRVNPADLSLSQRTPDPARNQSRAGRRHRRPALAPAHEGAGRHQRRRGSQRRHLPEPVPFLALPWQGFDQGHGKATP